MSSPNELSFLPEDYLARKARRRANILCGALSVVVMGTIGTAFALSERSMRGLDAELAEVDARYAEAAGRIDAVKRMHAKQKQIVQQAELAAALVEKVPRSNVLATFTNSLPPGVSLLDLSLESRVRQPSTPAGGATAFDARAAALAAAQKKPGPAEPTKYDVSIMMDTSYLVGSAGPGFFWAAARAAARASNAVAPPAGVEGWRTRLSSDRSSSDTPGGSELVNVASTLLRGTFSTSAAASSACWTICFCLACIRLTASIRPAASAYRASTSASSASSPRIDRSLRANAVPIVPITTTDSAPHRMFARRRALRAR